ncbi:siphovirus Gp157 family protein, partial [Enterobacter hormaechei]
CLLGAGLDKLKTPRNTFTARQGTVSVVVDNVDALPDEVVTVQTVIAPDK